VKLSHSGLQVGILAPLLVSRTDCFDLDGIPNTGLLKWTFSLGAASPSAFPRFSFVIVDARGRVVASEEFVVGGERSPPKKTPVDAKDQVKGALVPLPGQEQKPLGELKPLPGVSGAPTTTTTPLGAESSRSVTAGITTEQAAAADNQTLPTKAVRARRAPATSAADAAVTGTMTGAGINGVTKRGITQGGSFFETLTRPADASRTIVTAIFPSNDPNRAGTAANGPAAGYGGGNGNGNGKGSGNGMTESVNKGAAARLGLGPGSLVAVAGFVVGVLIL
jgi:hypothetical protein